LIVRTNEGTTYNPGFHISLKKENGDESVVCFVEYTQGADGQVGVYVGAYTDTELSTPEGELAYYNCYHKDAWRFEAFCQMHKNGRYVLVSIENDDLCFGRCLEKIIGPVHTKQLIDEATSIMLRSATPEAEAFFRRGGRQVILSRDFGCKKVYLEAVQI
jgi:hypothetical protein